MVENLGNLYRSPYLDNANFKRSKMKLVKKLTFDVGIRLVIDLLSSGIDPLCVLNCVNWISPLLLTTIGIDFSSFLHQTNQTPELIEKLYLE